MKSKALRMSIIGAAICIVAAAALLIYYNSTHYIINLKSDNVSKIVYCEKTWVAPENRKYITVTDKKDIQKVLDVYNGTVFKLYSFKKCNYPDGLESDIDIYNKNSRIILSLGSCNTYLYKNDKLYTNFSLPENLGVQYEKRAKDIFESQK